MGNCSDCDSNKDCKDDHGTYDDARASGTITDTDYCGNTYSTDYEYVHTVNPMEGDEDYDKIDDWKNIYMNGYFTEVPDALLGEQCDYGHWEAEPQPSSVDFVLEHSDGYDGNDYKFRDPVPEDDDDGGAVMDIVLAIVSAASSHPLVSAGAAAAGAWIDTSWGSGVSFDKTTVDGGQQFWWDIDVDGLYKDDFPQSPCDTNTVRFELDLNTSEGEVRSWSRYRMGVPEYLDSTGCPCSEDYAVYYHTSDWAYRPFQVEEA